MDGHHDDREERQEAQNKKREKHFTTDMITAAGWRNKAKDIPEDVDVNKETSVCTIQAQMVATIIRLMLVLMTCSTNKLCPGTVGWGEGGESEPLPASLSGERDCWMSCCVFKPSLVSDPTNPSTKTDLPPHDDRSQDRCWEAINDIPCGCNDYCHGYSTPCVQAGKRWKCLPSAHLCTPPTPCKK
ncbi:hypothetical protein C0Q70_02321 [Pomacea canaliculata]|uniref:Uncharacterized protein n=1 Tax=Pomacea canaliculata TaxID=400727 RepID=A0A2T7PPL5_POMCA|nr:hypothetical protein C0Q70_02321 [Pomacea canaliculata]